MRRYIWILVGVVALGLALSGQVDRVSEQSSAAALKRALLTFAVSRGLNAAISAAQGTELALEPAGVGVVLSVGQVLDPINDLVERFSTVMLVAASSIGLQSVLLRITSTWGFDVLLLLAVVWVAISSFVRHPALQGSLPWARRALLVALFIRFALPLLILGSNAVFNVFLEAEQQAALQALEGVQADIEEIESEPRVLPQTGQSWMDRFNNMIDDTLAAVDPRESLERLSRRVADASEHIISLIVIFVLQTILLPIALLWLLLEILKGAGRRLAGRVAH